MHQSCQPPILYFGTPVVIISTLNPDGSANLAPMSSAFWLGWRCVIGMGCASRTVANLSRTGQAVLNLPSQHQVAAVDRLALTTGADPVPLAKAERGYRHVADKFSHSGFTAQASETVAAPRVRECPVQMEAVVEAEHGLAEGDPLLHGRVRLFELRILRVHAEPDLLAEPNRIDPLRWRPLLMSFQRFFGLGAELAPSTLATIPEALYRSPDVDRAQRAAPGTGQPGQADDAVRALPVG